MQLGIQVQLGIYSTGTDTDQQDTDITRDTGTARNTDAARNISTANRHRYGPTETQI